VLEQSGLPTVICTAMYPIAEQVGAPRILAAQDFSRPFGGHDLEGAEERAYRGKLFDAALDLLTEAVGGTQIVRRPR
jgi:hypothetical protein